MPLVKQFPAMAHIEVAHLAFDPARVEAPATAEASPARDFAEQRVTPRSHAPQKGLVCEAYLLSALLSATRDGPLSLAPVYACVTTPTTRERC